MKQAAYDICYLAACAVNGVTPPKEKCEAMELDKLYKISKLHSLSALIAMALVSAGVKISDEWKADRDKAVRKNILFDSERAKLLKYMEENGIWYLPLKGIIMKDLYPKLGMREMADNDILFDKAFQKQMCEFMKACGYTVKSYDQSNHDTYMKEPVFNFELHTALFSDATGKLFRQYYDNVKERLVPLENKSFSYRMTDEDFYVYVTAHDYKHYSHSGTGLRSLLDRYVFITKKQLDYAYVERECAKMGIDEYEKKSRTLCRKVFGESDKELTNLSTEETEMLEYYMFSTTYGTMTQHVQNKIREDYGDATALSKLKYIWRRVFPPIEFYKSFWPVAYKYKVLIPFAWFYRFLRAVIKKGKKIKSELEVVKNFNEGGRL